MFNRNISAFTKVCHRVSKANIMFQLLFIFLLLNCMPVLTFIKKFYCNTFSIPLF